MRTKKVKKCRTCKGHGLWLDGTTPMGEGDAINKMPTLECPECKANVNPRKDK